jgi:hypothetical protein
MRPERTKPGGRMFSSYRKWIALALAVAAPGLGLAKGVAGVSPEGDKGWLHTVEPGDTLWDITQQYLGSPWIWPSVWRDNEIANPHRIQPGDLVWISDKGMRKLSPEEAAQIGPVPAEDSHGALPAAPASEDVVPAAQALTPEHEDDPFAALDRSSGDLQTTLHFPGLHRFGFVTPQELDGSAAVLGSHDERYWTSQEQRTIVGIGEGRTHIGDRFTLFRTRKRFDHPRTGQNLGYMIERLGTAEVTEIHTESSFVKVTSAYAEIQPGDRLMPYQEEPVDFTSVASDLKMDGTVVGVQIYRQYALRGDVVVIDRGADDGVQSGNRFEVFRPGKEVLDPVSTSRTLVPDDIIGEVMVLKSSNGTSLGLLTRANRPVQPGDHFRSY